MTHVVSKFASVCGTAAIAVMLASAPVSGQPGWGGMGGMRGMGPGLMGPGMMGGGGMWCNPRAAGLAEWRAERIDQLVRPTDAQRPKLDELRKASSRAAEIISRSSLRCGLSGIVRHHARHRVSVARSGFGGGRRGRTLVPGDHRSSRLEDGGGHLDRRSG